MRVPVSWLRELCDPGLPAEDLADVLTMAGLAVEALHRPTAGARGITVVRVEDMAPVPGSDKLTLVHASDGAQTWEIVCGARNYAPGDLVPAALPGAVLPGGMEIGRRKLMGVTSNGMLCSPRELGVGDDHRGIWVLDADAPLGADLAEWLGLDDVVLELELTPDRGYALSLTGVARDLAAMTGAELRLPAASAAPAEDAGVVVTIEDPVGCRRFTLRRISGVDAARPSPSRVQHRLALAGMRPISAVVDATNYGMLETGQPTHAFDLPALRGRITVRRARPGERLVTLDGAERVLETEDLLVCDADRPVALAGIMGGADTEVTDATTEVALEAASWDPRTILRTGRRHGLRSEARTRFERTIHPEVTAAAVGRVADLVAAFAGGAVTGASDTYPSPPEPVAVAVAPGAGAVVAGGGPRRPRAGRPAGPDRRAGHVRRPGPRRAARGGAAVVAAGPADRGRPLRGARAAPRLRAHPAARPVDRHPRSAAAGAAGRARRAARAGRRRVDRGAGVPVRRRRGPRGAGPARRRSAPAPPASRQPAVEGGAGPAHDAAAGAAAGRAPQRQPRCGRRRDLRDGSGLRAADGGRPRAAVTCRRGGAACRAGAPGPRGDRGVAERSS